MFILYSSVHIPDPNQAWHTRVRTHVSVNSSDYFTTGNLPSNLQCAKWKHKAKFRPDSHSTGIVLDPIREICISKTDDYWASSLLLRMLSRSIRTSCGASASSCDRPCIYLLWENISGSGVPSELIILCMQTHDYVHNNSLCAMPEKRCQPTSSTTIRPMNIA